MAIGFCGTLLVGIGPPLWRGTLDDPCRNNDSWQYESIAFSLVRGGGFSNWFDEAFAAPYFEHGSDERYEQFRAYAQTPEPTTLRPPLWPTIIACLYFCFGRHFWLVYVFNSLATAAVCAIFSHLIFRRAGPFPALLFAVFFGLWDPRTRELSRTMLTEATAALLMAFLVLALVALAERRKLWLSAAAGVCLALSVLNRSVFVFWLPGMLVLVAYLSADLFPLWNRERFKHVLMFLIVNVVLLTPWFVRNCLVLDEFMPQGTQGYIALGSAYSDWIYERNGDWLAIPGGVMKKNPGNIHLKLENEKLAALQARQMAIDWIKAHPGQLPGLIWMKVRRLWDPRSFREAALISPTLLGLFLFWRWKENVIFWFMLLMVTVQVGATYAAYGRFLYPLLGILLGAAAVGIWGMLVTVNLGLDRLRQLVLTENISDQPPA